MIQMVTLKKKTEQLTKVKDKTFYRKNKRDLKHHQSLPILKGTESNKAKTENQPIRLQHQAKCPASHFCYCKV